MFARDPALKYTLERIHALNILIFNVYREFRP